MRGRPVQRLSSVKESLEMRRAEELVANVRELAKTGAGFNKIALRIRRSGTAVRHEQWGSFGDDSNGQNKQKILHYAEPPRLF